MSNSPLHNPFVRFILIAIPGYALWYVLYSLVLQGGAIDQAIIGSLTSLSETVLNLFGFDVLPETDSTIRTVGIDGGHYVWIGEECDGFSLFALYTIFMLAYPGPIRKKGWYIPMGIIFIHFLNVIRIVSLVIIVKHYPESLDFNHTYVFTTIVYGFIFLLWYIWVEKFSGHSLRKSKAAAS